MKKVPTGFLKDLIVLSLLLIPTKNLFSQTPSHLQGQAHQSHAGLPVLGAWFWSEDEFNTNGYTTFIDNVNSHSPYNILTTSIRIFKKEITSSEVHNQVQMAVDYANELGIGIALDLDIRLARLSFEAKYPDELQELLMLQEVPLSCNDSMETVFRSYNLQDHMTPDELPYIPIQGSLLRVYTYEKTTKGIDSSTLMEITQQCLVASSSKDSVVVRIPSFTGNHPKMACAMVTFTHLTPDLFAPHLVSFQNEIIHSYADIPLAGGMKDEWGFPPTRLPVNNKFWYSEYRAEAYGERTGGRELIYDCLLMYLGINGQEGERQMAINHLMEMNWQRNGALENDFYQTIKEVFGPNAVVVTHPTWYASLCENEYKKNALSWWAATRDWAQTDEEAPFSVRTSLAKRWNSPVWYNQYYATDIESYQRELWSSALAGGRVNFHPIYPDSSGSDGHLELFKGNLMQGESRVRLLDYIAETPLDCPVAVIFGHAAIMNWAGSTYNDAGIMELVNQLWCIGIPTDLIPSSEIDNKSLFIDHDGRICYGKQRYSAIVLYNPEFEKVSTADFFMKASKGNTRLFRIGDWTRNFNGQVYNGQEALPKSMGVHFNHESLLSEISDVLNEQKFSRQTPALKLDDGDLSPLISHPTTGFSTLIDGTFIQIAGTEHMSGDPIYSTVRIQNCNVFFDAIGVAAVRLNRKGEVEAMAAGGLKTIKAGDFEIELKDRTDIALWADDKGEWEGVIQGWEGELPTPLLEITHKWSRLRLPVSLSE
ncbi:MAG: hypothetical protein V2B15_19740 [Bacteroidota bacterium]